MRLLFRSSAVSSSASPANTHTPALVLTKDSSVACPSLEAERTSLGQCRVRRRREARFGSRPKGQRCSHQVCAGNHVCTGNLWKRATGQACQQDGYWCGRGAAGSRG